MQEPIVTSPLMKFVYAWVLLAACVSLHSAGLITLAGWLGKAGESPSQRFLKRLWLLVRLAGAIILLHVLQILFWALFYLWRDCMPDLSTAFYFSAVTYTTVGYGDLVLPVAWRNMAGIEALTGILMGGLSTGFFFMALNRMFETESRRRACRVLRRPRTTTMSHVTFGAGPVRSLRRGDVPGVLGTFAADIAWREAEGNPYQPSGQAWVGPEAVLQNLFMRMGVRLGVLHGAILRYHHAGETVIVEGRYTAKHKQSAKALDCQFCHVWQIRDGKIASFQQYTDTAQWQDVMQAR